MEGITHKIKLKLKDHEIEITGSREFTEHWFEKLHDNLYAGEIAAKAARKKSGRRPGRPRKTAAGEIKTAAATGKAAARKARRAPAKKTARKKAGSTPTTARRKPGRKPGKKAVKIIDNILSVAYSKQIKDGKNFLLITDIRDGLLKEKLKMPKKPRDLSIAIGNNIKKGYLERMNKTVGKQKAFCLSEKGRKYVENGFK